MATKWRLAKSLTKLREQLNAKHPNRSKVSDGSIGDAAHSSRTSDHNPNAKGVVTAIDITHDPANGVVGAELAEAIKDDIRVKYLIFAGRIYKARTKRWEKYTGANRHDKHVHVSVTADAKGYDDSSAWNLGDDEKADAPQPVVEQPKDPPPKEINAETATTVHPSQPSVLGQLGSISIPAGVTTALATIGRLFMGIPPWAWALIVVAGILVAAYLWNQKRQRAHERTLRVVSIAADPKSNNVYIGESQ